MVPTFITEIMASQVVTPEVLTLDTKIYVGYGVTFNVTVNKNSGIIYTAQLDMERMSNEAVPFDLEKFLLNINVVAVTNYVCFLRGLKVEIVDRDTMMGSLQIYSLTEDKDFFKYTLEQLFKFWILLSPVLYDDRLATEIKWDVWCHCPRQVLPQWFLDDRPSMTTWSRNPDNKLVTLNTTDTLEYVVKEESKDVNEPDGENTGTKKVTYHGSKYHRDADNFGLIVIDKTTVVRNLAGEQTNEYNLHSQSIVEGGNIVEHGLEIQTNPFTGLRQSGVDFEGRNYGPSVAYHHDKPDYEGYYVDGKQVGTYRSYYESGRIKDEENFSLSGKIITENTYYDDTDHTLKSHADYEDDKFVCKITHELDASRIEVTREVMSYYDKDGDLTRQITNPFEKGEKHELTYNEQGQIVGDTLFDPDLFYYYPIDEWTY